MAGRANSQLQHADRRRALGARRGMGVILVVLSSLLTAAIASVAPAIGEEPPRIKSVDEQVEDCRSLGGGGTDDCLVRLAVRHDDPSLCARIPESRCGALLGPSLMQRCANLSPDERLLCEIAAAQQTGAVDLCETALDPGACIGAIAAERGDPQLIVDHVHDPYARDVAISTYATNQRDRSAIELIDDNRRHDQALVMVIAGLGVGRDEIIDPSFCKQLRGGYEVSEVFTEDEAAVLRLCHAAVIFSNFITTQRDQSETPSEREAVIALVKGIVAALERGEMNAEGLAGLAGQGCLMMPGLWSWFVNGDVTIKADGTMEQGPITGTWSCQKNTVTMSWSHGYDDVLVLSEDGMSLGGSGKARDPAGPQGYPVSGAKNP